MITARYIEWLGEVRLYHDDGQYWPIKISDKDEAISLVKFVDRSYDFECSKSKGDVKNADA